MTEGNQKNCMDVLTKFMDRINKQNSCKAFFTMYGASKTRIARSDLSPNPTDEMAKDFFGSHLHASEIPKFNQSANQFFDYGDNVTQDLLAGENGYQNIKKLSILRLKGRALLAASKATYGPSIRQSFFRWYVRTNKSAAKRCIEKLCLGLRFSIYSSFYRFKEIYRPVMVYQEKVQRADKIIQKNL